MVSRDMHLLYLEAVEHNQGLSGLEEVTPAELLRRIVACLQEGGLDLIGFVANEIQDHNARRFRGHELTFHKLCGGSGLS